MNQSNDHGNSSTLPASSHGQDRRGGVSGGAVLGASAFILAALVVMKAGELPANEAYAGTASTGSGFSMVTASNGFGKDTRPYELLFVVDNRSEMLFVYEIEDAAQRRVTLKGGQSLPALMRAGRGR